MAGRELVWSDPAVRALVRRTVPCADEVWKLQRGDDGESLAFQSMADGGHYSGKGGTRQGIYLATPGGRLLASINSLNAEAVAQMLREGLATWDALEASERSAPPVTAPREAGAEHPVPAHRWEWNRPEGGLVLRVTLRDLPTSLDPTDPRGTKWNRDHAWFSREEARAWLPETLEVGAVHPLPLAVTERLARFHLVDAVIGQGMPYAREEVQGSHLHSRVVAVVGARVEIVIEGKSRAVADGVWRLGDNDWKPDRPWPRGLLSQLLGHATYDLERGEFVAFELQAHGVRWGRSPFNARGDDAGPSPLGFLFTLVEDGDTGSGVAPAFIDVYDAPWLASPRAPR